MRKISGIAVLSGLLAFPIAAQAQGPVGATEKGASDGNRAIGSVAGIVSGSVIGILGVDPAPSFHAYVAREYRSA